ncbi:hypothetical protein CBS101457_001050 [Exobasidium rhododendri]|nr:hypothetical protein CBS101457_001050 [Exobasidium rhododendri]
MDDAASDAGSGKSVYRTAGLRSDLATWAPSAKPPMEQWSGISNLPDWSTLRGNEPTSMPIVHVQRDLDWSMRRLLNETVFEQLVNDPLGRHRFREHLAHKTGTEHKLDMYFDLCQYTKQNEAIRKSSEALHDIYLAQDSDGHVPLPAEMSEDFYETIKRQYEVRASLGSIQQHLLKSLYKTEFQTFVKAQLIEHNKVKLGSFADEDVTRSGLGDCFCLTNPRLRENPIVLVSPGFEKVTGYPRQQIIGRNCRFLQGPGTAPDSVQRIRDSLNAGESSTELILNYTRDGTPFFCLLNIIPLRDATGTLVYFIGGQTNVNGQLASSKGLKFLIGGGATDPGEGMITQGSIVNGVEVSPTVARYFQGLNSNSGNADGSSISPSGSDKYTGDSRDVHSRRGQAAGSYDPSSRRGPANTFDASSPVQDLMFDRPVKKGNAVSRLFGRSAVSKAKGGSNSLGQSLESPSQRLAGAEGTMRKDHHTLADQMDYFTSLYSKAIIFKRTKREIIFATKECIAYFDLPIDAWKDIYNSPLIHADLLSIIEGSDKEETKAVQTSIQQAVRNGESISVHTGIRRPKQKRRFLTASANDWIAGMDGPKFTTIHITPLRDRDNSSFAFVAIIA